MNMHESDFVAAFVDFYMDKGFPPLTKPSPVTYLEFGIRNGDTFNKVAPLVDIAYAVDHVDCLSPICHNDNLKWHKMTTDDFISQLENETFDIVFIDADHSYNQCFKDFEGIFSYVKDNGFILLHDTYPPQLDCIGDNGACGDAYKVAWYIRKNLNDVAEIVTIPSEFGLSIVRKSSKQVLWME